MNKINVAVAVILDGEGQVLIAKRHQHVHQGGKWEFPGGKIEHEETPLQALTREIIEEVNLHVIKAESMMNLDFDYGDKIVSLHVWLVKQYTGQAVGVEGQTIEWVPLNSLLNFEFPSANQPIIEQLLLM